ncbi:retention module-containing protein, partial [Thiomicrorhabdus arctica]|uniref:retention module-containing protein n=1 Tax=Thiomicrorhabdus arctica TaxID=131540 RepID=UPI00035E40A5
MSTFTGEVSTLQGLVRAVNPETGEARILEKGSPVYDGEVIETSLIGGVLIDMQNGTQLTLGRDTQMLIDGDVADNASVLDAATEGAVDVAALQQAVLEGNFDELEATAAGEGVIPGSASDGGITVDRIAAQGDITSGFETATTSSIVTEVPQDPLLAPTDPTATATATTTNTGASTVLTLNDISLEEGSQTGTVTATLGVAPTDGPLVIALNNGATITFEIGQTEATSTPFEVQSDDVFVDGEEFLLSATVQSGGNQFSAIDVSDTATVTITDTIDDTGVSLSATTDITEAGADVTYTATLTSASQGDTVVTLDNGESITITDGQLTGTATVSVAASDDVYLDEGTMQAAITSATGGNFEKLVVDATPAVTKITDTVDTTTVSVSVSPAQITEDATAITYTASVDNATETAMTVTLSDGTEIIIPAGETSGSTEVAITADSDVFAEDATSISATITGTTGGNFENVLINPAAASTSVVDSIDNTTVSLSVSPAQITEDATAI